MRCPNCDCAIFYTNVKGYQFYDENGEPTGFNIDTESKTIHCLNCGNTFSRDKIFKKDNSIYA